MIADAVLEELDIACQLREMTGNVSLRGRGSVDACAEVGARHYYSDLDTSKLYRDSNV